MFCLLHAIASCAQLDIFCTRSILYQRRLDCAPHGVSQIPGADWAKIVL
jgi:hypothetical protein